MDFQLTKFEMLQLSTVICDTDLLMGRMEFFLGEEHFAYLGFRNLCSLSSNWSQVFIC